MLIYLTKEFCKLTINGFSIFHKYQKRTAVFYCSPYKYHVSYYLEIEPNIPLTTDRPTCVPIDEAADLMNLSSVVSFRLLLLDPLNKVSSIPLPDFRCPR